MLALPARMDLISDPDNTSPAVNSSVRKYVYDAFLFLMFTAMPQSYRTEGCVVTASVGTCLHD